MIFSDNFSVALILALVKHLSKLNEVILRVGGVKFLFASIE